MRTPRATYTLLFAAGFCASASPCHAEEAPATDNLDAVVVTATRTEQPRALTGESISLITAPELQVWQALVVTDALQATPGAVVMRNGGVGQTAGLGLRGATAGQTLVLIDGVRINDPSSPDGSVILSDLLVNNLDRIEILRGPQSTLYGSDAIGGVVNLISQRGGGTTPGLVMTAEGGSLNTYRANLAANGTSQGLEYGTAVNYYRTGGISAADSANGNSETDSYRNVGATANLRWHLTDQLSIDARSYYTNTQVNFDGYPPPDYVLKDTLEYGDNTLLSGYLGVNLDLLDGRFHNRIALLRTRSDRELFDPTQEVTETFFARGQSRRLEYQGVFDVSPADQLSFGAESQHTSLNTGSPSSFDPNPVPTTGDSRINGYYLQYQSTLQEQLTLTGGLRRDENSGFGDHNSVKLSAAWQPRGTDTVLRANLGDGFKAPSLYELFSPYSNPVRNLAPESSRGWEAGVDQRLLDGRVRLSGTYFEQRTHDEIDFFGCYPVVTPACSTRPDGYYDNIASSRAHGVELEVAVAASQRLSVNGNVTRMRSIDETTGYELPRRPNTLANVRVDWIPATNWTTGAALLYTGSHYDDSVQSLRLPGSTVVGLTLAQTLSAKLQWYARLDNVLDRHYETVAGYGTLPRTIAVGVRVKP
jgi:vitamin B12 transporter